MKPFIMTLFFMFTLMMYFIKNPLNLGLIILTQTLIICIMMNFYLNFYWLSYILYLIMLGGILILFMYMCSIASNKLIQFNVISFLYLLIMSIMVYLILTQIKWVNMNSIQINNLNFLLSNETLSMSKMYNNFTFKISILLIIYLFILLLMVTILTNSNKGPLRILTL